jgi:UDP-GlcNAc:undecaprenyl-phosphate GlcNAc-1-phosphate transferase
MSNFFVADTVSLPSVIAAGFVLCLAVTPYISALARRMGVLDIPRDSRRMHKRAVPLIGGLRDGAFVFDMCRFVYLFLCCAL